jgi:hypothetical protein
MLGVSGQVRSPGEDDGGKLHRPLDHELPI